MEHITFENSKIHANSPNCIVREYPSSSKELNIAVGEITNRYPDSGYVVNEKCTEMGYVLKGSGRLVTETSEANLSEGDVVIIPAGEKYYWEGTMTVILPVSPAWFPEQHKHFDE